MYAILQSLGNTAGNSITIVTVFLTITTCKVLYELPLLSVQVIKQFVFFTNWETPSNCGVFNT